MTKTRLGELLEVQNGFAFSSEQFRAPGEGVPLIRIRDLVSGSPQASYVGDYREDFLVTKGDLLIGMDGDFTCHAWSGETALLNQRVCRLRNLASELDKDFLRYWINDELRAIQAVTSFVTVKHISSKQIANLEIPLPPLDEQRHIVDLLSRAESLKRLAEDAQAKARDLIPALFVDMFGDPASNPRGLDQVELGGLIATGPQNGVYRPASDYGQGVRIIRVDSFGNDGTLVNEDALRRVNVGVRETESYGVHAGDILINRVNSRSHLGKSTLVPALAEPTIFESNMMRFSVDLSRCLPEFVFASMQMGFSRAHFLSRAKDAINQSSINQGDVRSLPIMLPPLDAQREFANRITAIGSVGKLAECADTMANDVSASLMARLFAS